MAPGRFLAVAGVGGKLECRVGAKPGPVETRLRAEVTFDRAIPFDPRSGWLLREGRGGIESRPSSSND